MFDASDLDSKTAAYHEAGHVLMAHLLGGNVVHTTLESDDGELMGLTTVQWRTQPDAERHRRSALVALAGPIAEARWRGETVALDALTAWLGDWQEVQQALQAQSPDRDATQLLREWLSEVREQIDDPSAWERLCRVADALEAHGTLHDVLLDEVLGRD